MKLLDRVKETASTAGDKAQDFAKDHRDQVKSGIDKVAGRVDDRTKGKQSSKIDKAAAKAKSIVDRLADKN